MDYVPPKNDEKYSCIVNPSTFSVILLDLGSLQWRFPYSYPHLLRRFSWSGAVPLTSIPTKPRRKKLPIIQWITPLILTICIPKVAKWPPFFANILQKRELVVQIKFLQYPFPEFFLPTTFSGKILPQKYRRFGNLTPKNDKWKCRFSRWYISIRSPSGSAKPIFASLKWLVPTGLDKIYWLSIGYGFRSFWKGPPTKSTCHLSLENSWHNRLENRTNRRKEWEFRQLFCFS